MGCTGNARPRRAIPRTVRYRLIITLERANNRLTRWALRRGWAPRAFALLETTGRHTGEQADYVRNIKNNSRVRVKVAGAWRSGTAVLLPDDDPGTRSRTLPYKWDAAIGRAMATRPLTIRIDLDPD